MANYERLLFFGVPERGRSPAYRFCTLDCH